VEFLGENAGCSERNHGKFADEHIYAALKHTSVDFNFMPWTILYYQFSVYEWVVLCSVDLLVCIYISVNS